MRTEWDEDKVPEDFPRMRAQGHIYSKMANPYIPYYPAKEVWKWFKTHCSGEKVNE